MTWIDPASRCRHPVEYYELAGRPRSDTFPVCWRPRGHKSSRHQSEHAYRHMLELGRQRKAALRREMPDPRASVAA